MKLLLGRSICLLSQDKMLYHKEGYELGSCTVRSNSQISIKTIWRHHKKIFTKIPKFLRYESATARIQLAAIRKLCT